MSLAAAAPSASRIIRPRNEGPVDAAKALADLNKAFNEFRTTNDARIKAVEENKGCLLYTSPSPRDS